jgi:uncharacterized protein (TIGR00297 family)
MSSSQILTGLGLGFGIGLLAWRAGALSPSGGLAAGLTGGLIFGLGGLRWAVLLLAFFLSSSGLSFAFRERKGQIGEKFAKGSRRDWGQVLANGSLGALLAVVQASTPHLVWPWVAFAGALAAVNADTWATELGVLSPKSPRLITTGKTVAPGTSGGVTWGGTLAALVGAALIAVLAAVLRPEGNPWSMAAAVSLAGLAGSTLDSLLGATVQGIYRCPVCGVETERHPHHSCGAQTEHLRGWRWLNNDLVNLAASLMGAGAAYLAWLPFA